MKPHNTKPVIGPDGTRYDSACEAARATGVGRDTIRNRCYAGRGGWSWANVDDVDFEAAVQAEKAWRRLHEAGVRLA